MRMISRGLLAASLLLGVGVAGAQEMDHSKMHEPAPGAGSPSTEAYKAADAAMHGAMSRDYTGDADLDFLKGMIPHHQGAIDMARVALKYGKDPAVKRLAEEIISAQEKEIAEMKTDIARLSKPTN